jgi:Adenylate cyclase regulatory domain
VSSSPGGLDPAALGPDAVRAVRDMLRGLGCTEEELDRAQRDGTLPLLAVERLIVPEAPAYTLDDVTARTGISVEQVAQLWRTLGYPAPRPGELAFTRTDLDILTEIGQLMAENVTSHDLVLQLSRVIGSSVARIASAQVDVISARVSGSPRRGAVAGRPVTEDQIVAATCWPRSGGGSAWPRPATARRGSWASPTSSGGRPSASRQATTAWPSSSTGSSSWRSTR